MSQRPVVLVRMATNKIKRRQVQPPCLRVRGSCRMPVPMQVQRMEKRADCSTFLNMAGKVCGVRVVLVVDPLSEIVVALRFRPCFSCSRIRM